MPIRDHLTFVWAPSQDSAQAGRENCVMQSIIAGGAGGVLGLGLGVILAPFQSNVQSLDAQNLPLKEQMRLGAKEMASQSKSWGKNLLVIGAVFSCSECIVEKTRGRTDRWNPILGGCVCGAVLAAQAGPQAMGMGCAGFAAFSAAIDAMGFGQFD
mmetsp:Transcript_14043/g.36327  ORF Transcript_14043/g.36327 Transcript_14043/m.36327 type:complete len:156 (+) Transcript_14043:85-552(+)